MLMAFLWQGSTHLEGQLETPLCALTMMVLRPPFHSTYPSPSLTCCIALYTYVRNYILLFEYHGERREYAGVCRRRACMLSVGKPANCLQICSSGCGWCRHGNNWSYLLGRIPGSNCACMIFNLFRMKNTSNLCLHVHTSMFSGGV